MTPPGTTALLLVDLQRDYLDRPGLVPDEAALVAATARLLRGFRQSGAPIAHVRTLVRADGSDAMAHWRAAPALPCVEGSPGAAPPEALAEQEGELVARKSRYRGFADPELDGWLRARGVARVVIAGIYAHACVRETALDAFELGYDVTIADEAVGSDDPVHAERTRSWLDGRAATYRGVDDILDTLSAAGAAPAALVRSAVHAATAAQAAWATVPGGIRADLLDRWAGAMEAERVELERIVVTEVRKPRRAAADEVHRAIAHVRTAAAMARRAAPVPIADGITVRQAPVGVVGIVMPWNNPLALPCAKIAPALALGNSVVFKPAPEGAGTARLLLSMLASVGAPPSLVTMVSGGASVGSALVRDPGIDAVAVTGSIATGRSIATACARRGIPLQAELGGNNAAIVLPDADLADVVPALVRNAFAYAGQRCTAVRRFVVHRDILSDFERRAAEAVAALRIGDPEDDPDLGPVISVAAAERITAAVSAAVASGAILVASGVVPDAVSHDAFVPATLLRADDPALAIVQEETFGPVAVIQPADDLDEAIALANGVEQGLLMAACTDDPAALDRIRHEARVGILQVGGGILPVHPDAPFGGWKASGIGPPEHGVWDEQFMARPQAVYGRA